MKKRSSSGAEGYAAVTDRVASMLAEIDAGGEERVKRYCRELDGWTGELVVSRSEIEEAGARLAKTTREDIAFAHQRIRDFALAQRDSLREFEVTLVPGLVAGQRLIPVTTVGCYVPGGRFAHVASALMSVATARAAGVSNIIATSPANAKRGGIHPGVLYALQLAGADVVLAIGGAHGVAALARGLFSGHSADVIVGPGNAYVAEAKRLLFGRIGIDVIAGPTDTLVVADDTADPALVTADLVGQAEHGVDSPVWLITTSRALGEEVIRRAPGVIDSLPPASRDAATAAWRDHAEVAVVADRQAACALCNEYAPEHLHVQAADLDWWLKNLVNYGSLFLGEQSTVAYGDKCAGPNHILPTMGAARYSGGLNVGKFIKTVTYQRMTTEASRELAPVAARISRLEGMEGHAMTADIRLAKYFPDEDFDLANPETS
ncbi:MAG: histidinol dehydrogenase [Proteobacteria bacterium]|nr:histidinol dehydrogenase [Pseudomonadota bacterium]